MVVKSLDDIVLEDDVRELIRPFFEHATASGTVSFEHDWQWNAYCDIIYALFRHGNGVFVVWESVELGREPDSLCSTLQLRRVTLSEYLDYPRTYAEVLESYSPTISKVLRQSLDKHGLMKFCSLDTIKPYIMRAVQFVNNQDDKRIEVCAALQSIDIGNRSDGLEYFERLYEFLKGAFDEEIGELKDAVAGNGFFSEKKERLKEVVAHLVSYDYTYRNYPYRKETSRVAEAIECVEISEHKDLAGYVIRCRVGEGAGRVVYKAYYEKDDCEVAVKVQKREGEVESEHRRKLEREYGRRELATHEGRLARQLTHQNLVRYFDRGTLDDGRQYVIEEYIEGNTLEKEIRQGTALHNEPRYNHSLNPAKAIHELLQAVAYLHKKRYAHLDIKPANIMIHSPRFITTLWDTLKTLKLGDLELVREIYYTENETTENYGSRIYTAPELLERNKLSLQADVFSLGIVLYELFEIEHPFLPAAGQFEYRKTYISWIDDDKKFYDIEIPIKQVNRDFKEEDKEVIIRNICTPEYYATLEEKIRNSKDIPERYKPLIARCLKYDPKERYVDAIEMEEEFSRIERAEVKKEEKVKRRGKKPLYATIGVLFAAGVFAIGINNNAGEESSEGRVTAGEEILTLDQEIDARFQNEERKEYVEHLTFLYENRNMPPEEYSTLGQCLLAQHLLGKSGPAGSEKDYRILAARVLERVNNEEPDHANMHYLLGVTYLDLGRITEGSAELEEARTIMLTGNKRDSLSVTIEEINTLLGIVYESTGDFEGGVLKLGDAYHEDYVNNPHQRYWTNQYAKDYCIALENYEAKQGTFFIVVPESERTAMADFCCRIDCYDKFTADTACYPSDKFPEDARGNTLYCSLTEPFHCFCDEEIRYEEYWLKRMKEEIVKGITVESNLFTHTFCEDGRESNMKLKFMGTSTSAWYGE